MLVQVLLVIVLISTVAIQAFTEKVTQRENAKKWIKSEKVVGEYEKHLVGLVYDQDSLKTLSLLISEENLTQIVSDSIPQELVFKAVDRSVDKTYDWLEGKSENPDLEIFTDQFKQEADLQGQIERGLGELGNIVDESKLINDDEANIFNVENRAIKSLPEAYQNLESLPKKFMFALLIIAVIMVLTASSMRAAFLQVGTALLLAGAAVFFLPQLIEYNQEWVSERILSLSKLPEVVELPRFFNSLAEVAAKDIYTQMRSYSLILLAVGFAVAVFSQLSIRQIEVEED